MNLLVVLIQESVAKQDTHTCSLGNTVKTCHWFANVTRTGLTLQPDSEFRMSLCHVVHLG